MKVGDDVGWKWANGIAMGVIESIHLERTEIISKGSHVVRNGSSDDPAVIIIHDNGVKVLKLQHELQRIKQKGGVNV